MNRSEQVRGLLDEIFTKQEAEQWLDTPQRLLDGQVPRLLLQCGEDQRVEQVLQSIVDGIYP